MFFESTKKEIHHNITIIAAVAKNGVIGDSGGLPWDLPRDRKFFKDYITGKYVVIGARTYCPISKHIDLYAKEVYIYGRDIMDYLYVLKRAYTHPKEEVVVAGGGKVYHDLIYRAGKLIITEIETITKGDCCFPKFDKSLYTKKLLFSSIENGLSYETVEYNLKTGTEPAI